MSLTLVAAVAKNGVIGSHNALPWYIPEDLKHFKDVTMGKPCLMGKNSFDSIMVKLGKPLPGRLNVVLTRQTDWTAPEGVLVFHTLDEALEALKDKEEIMVTGGGQIYKQTIDQADRLILTEIDKEIDGDVLFPEYDKSQWQKIAEEKRDGFSWVTYDRIKI